MRGGDNGGRVSDLVWNRQSVASRKSGLYLTTQRPLNSETESSARRKNQGTGDV